VFCVEATSMNKARWGTGLVCEFDDEAPAPPTDPSVAAAPRRTGTRMRHLATSIAITIPKAPAGHSGPRGPYHQGRLSSALERERLDACPHRLRPSARLGGPEGQESERSWSTVIGSERMRRRASLHRRRSRTFSSFGATRGTRWGRRSRTRPPGSWRCAACRRSAPPATPTSSTSSAARPFGCGKRLRRDDSLVRSTRRSWAGSPLNLLGATAGPRLPAEISVVGSSILASRRRLCAPRPPTSLARLAEYKCVRPWANTNSLTVAEVDSRRPHFAHPHGRHLGSMKKMSNQNPSGCSDQTAPPTCAQT
jgi:hypothetical protein